MDSDFDLAPLVPIESTAVADIRILRSIVPETGIDPKTPSARIEDGCLRMNIPEIARIDVNQGTEILVDAAAGADEQSVALYIMGSGLGTILHQRGHLVLHANAVRVGEGAVLFAGNSGAGKSSVAAAFHRQGFEVISDDVVALNNRGDLVGGFPQIKLWQDVCDQLDIPTDNLKKISLQRGKYSFPIDAAYRDLSLPVLALYILDVEQPDVDIERFTIETLAGMETFFALKQHTYRNSIMEGLGLMPEHLRLCEALSSSIHIATISRSRQQFRAMDLVQGALADLQAHGICSEEAIQSSLAMTQSRVNSESNSMPNSQLNSVAAISVSPDSLK